MDNQEQEIDRLHNEPSLPPAFTVVTSLITLGSTVILNWSNTITVLAIIAFALFLISGLLCHYLSLALINKKHLYIAYKESQKRLKTQTVMNQKLEEELTAIRTMKLKELSEFYLPYLLKEAAASLSINHQRKDEKIGL